MRLIDGTSGTGANSRAPRRTLTAMPPTNGRISALGAHRPCPRDHWTARWVRRSLTGWSRFPATTPPDVANDPEREKGDRSHEEQAGGATERQIAAPPDARLARREPVPAPPRELEVRLRQPDRESQGEQDPGGSRRSTHARTPPTLTPEGVGSDGSDRSAPTDGPRTIHGNDARGDIATSRTSCVSDEVVSCSATSDARHARMPVAPPGHLHVGAAGELDAHSSRTARAMQLARPSIGEQMR
jgi:hypothetical protein